MKKRPTKPKKYLFLRKKKKITLYEAYIALSRAVAFNLEIAER